MLKSLIILAALSLGTSTGSSTGKYYNDFATEEACLQAASELNKEICAEGMTLLKNDGTLPLHGNERVSVFGVRNDSLTGGSANGGAFDTGSSSTTESVADSLTQAGFIVNPTLKNVYDNDSSSIGSEITSFNGSVENSMDIYNDAAFIVFSRAGGEGSDQSTVTSETVDRSTDDHADLYEATVEENGQQVTKRYKHSLMLTDSEEELVEYVKQRFSKIVVILNTSNPMEVDELDKDPSINAIIDISRPGQNGIFALGEIINGTVNPSGRIQDVWDADHSADPTWQNFGNNSQVGASATMLDPDKRQKSGNGDDDDPDSYPYNTSLDGAITYEGGTLDYTYYSIDYEEDIYIGYKYYETRYAETYDDSASAGQEWFEENVTYPFGYGLSYTTFSMNILQVSTDEDGANQVEENSILKSTDLENAPGKKANIDKLYVQVKVTNTGTVAGKQTVQLYAHSPYTGKLEKAEHIMVGFEKTDLLQPGESETVTIEINVQDMASWDTDHQVTTSDGQTEYGCYTLEGGEYILRAMDSSHFDRSTDISDTSDTYDQFVFNVDQDTYQRADDYSLNEVYDQFTHNEAFDEDATENKFYFNSLRTSEMMADDTSEMTLMSRSDFEGTFPKAPTAADRTFKTEWYSNTTYWGGWDQDEGYKDKESDPWYIEEVPSDWTQSTDDTTIAAIQFKDMVGIDWQSDEVIESHTNSELVGLTQAEAWTKFMNQLTWDQIAEIVEYGGYGTVALENVGKAADTEADGPNNMNSSFQWADEPTLASTFNKDLIYKEGQIMGDICMFEGVTGWYGPGLNYHRSPFSGRNNEYYSQDAYVCGTIASYAIRGAQSRGVIAYAKHIAFNDQETNRGETFEWISEQAIRENDLKSFQIAFQEGGSKAGMVGYGHICGIANTNNYNLLTNVYKNEWGWTGTLDTDGYIGWINITSPDLMNRAGCELELRTSPWAETPSGTWDTTQRNGLGGVMVKTGANGALEISPNQYYYTRISATRILWNRTESTGMQNGYTTLQYSGEDIAINQYESISNISVALDETQLTEGSFVSYAVTSGSLPEGLSLDSSTGSVSGTTSDVGTKTVTITATIDGYVKKEGTFNFVIASAFSLDEDGDDVSSMKVGQEFMTQINSTVFTTAGGKYDSVVYSVGDGKLPDGLEITEDGIIQGTPTAAGDYTATIKIVASKQSSSGGGWGGFPGGGFPGGGSSSSTETTEATYEISFHVEAGESEEEEVVNTYTVTFETNGGTAVNSQTVEEGGTLAAFNNPTRAGYIFTGWYTDSTCTTAADLNAAITSNVTYYAGWQAIETDDGSGDTTPTPDTDTDTTPTTTTESSNALAVTGIVLGSVGTVAALASILLLLFKKH